MLEQTYHQERSAKTLNNMDTLLQLYTRSEYEKIRRSVFNQMMQLGVWQIEQWQKAKEDKAKGGEGIMHSKVWEN